MGKGDIKVDVWYLGEDEILDGILGEICRATGDLGERGDRGDFGEKQGGLPLIKHDVFVRFVPSSVKLTDAIGISKGRGTDEDFVLGVVDDASKFVHFDKFIASLLS